MAESQEQLRLAEQAAREGSARRLDVLALMSGSQNVDFGQRLTGQTELKPDSVLLRSGNLEYVKLPGIHPVGQIREYKVPGPKEFENTIYGVPVAQIGLSDENGELVGDRNYLLIDMTTMPVDPKSDGVADDRSLFAKKTILRMRPNGHKLVGDIGIVEITGEEIGAVSKLDPGGTTHAEISYLDSSVSDSWAATNFWIDYDNSTGEFAVRVIRSDDDKRFIKLTRLDEKQARREVDEVGTEVNNWNDDALSFYEEQCIQAKRDRSRLIQFGRKVLGVASGDLAA